MAGAAERIEGRRIEGRRIEGRRIEGRRIEGRRIEDRRIEGRRKGALCGAAGGRRASDPLSGSETGPEDKVRGVG